MDTKGLKPYSLFDQAIFRVVKRDGSTSEIRAINARINFTASSEDTSQLPSAALLLSGGSIDPDGLRIRVGIVQTGAGGGNKIVGHALLLRQVFEELCVAGWEPLLEQPRPLMSMDLLMLFDDVLTETMGVTGHFVRTSDGDGRSTGASSGARR